MDEIDFNTSFSAAFNMHLDILADVYCWQQIILSELATSVAVREGLEKSDILAGWEDKKKTIRQHLIEQIYEKHGPDLSSEFFSKEK